MPERIISSEEGVKLAKKFDANFIEVSALSGSGIDNIFEALTNDIYQYKLHERQNLEIEQGDFNRTSSKRKIIISSGNERYEKRFNDDGSCVC